MGRDINIRSERPNEEVNYSNPSKGKEGHGGKVQLGLIRASEGTLLSGTKDIKESYSECIMN